MQVHEIKGTIFSMSHTAELNKWHQPYNEDPPVLTYTIQLIASVRYLLTSNN